MNTALSAVLWWIFVHCVFCPWSWFWAIARNAGKLNVVVEERREDAEREAAERQELEAKRQQAIEYIISLGLDPESLLAPVTADTVKTRRKAKGGVRKAKYRFKDENGEIREWSGNGKRPLALQKLLDEGHFMEDFLIEKTKPEQAE